MTLPVFKVLLVEDDKDDYVLTRDLLAEADTARYELRWVPDPEEALSLLGQDGFDVCLVDYRLGGSTGVEFVRRALLEGADLPLVLLTGQPDREIDVAAMAAGAADFLSKDGLTRESLERSLRYCIQQKRAEQQRMQLLTEQAARREAEGANRAKDEFLATLSHELRTPLTAVLGWIELLRRGPDAGVIAATPSLAHAVEVIDRNARSQARLIDDLLDMSRVVTGKLRLTPREGPLGPIVTAAADTVRPAAEARQVNLSVSIAPGLPDVRVDADRMQQVVWNLVSNAVKFTGPGGRIDVTLSGRSASGDAPPADRRSVRSLRIMVRDTGRGIDPNFLPFVFDRFQQAETPGLRGPGGLGLGLTIVRHLVEAHGGTVQAESQGEDQGATFIVDLPVASGGYDGASF